MQNFSIQRERKFLKKNEVWKTKDKQRPGMEGEWMEEGLLTVGIAAKLILELNA